MGLPTATARYRVRFGCRCSYEIFSRNIVAAAARQTLAGLSYCLDLGGLHLRHGFGVAGCELAKLDESITDRTARLQFSSDASCNFQTKVHIEPYHLKPSTEGQRLGRPYHPPVAIPKRCSLLAD